MITSVWVQIQTVHDYKHDSSHYTFPLSSPVGPAFNTIFTHSRNPKIEDTSLFPTQLKRRRRKCWLLSCVWLFVNTGTVTHHAPLSMVFSQQEYWTGVPLPSPGNFPNYLSVALKSERIKQEAKVWCAFSLPLLGGIQLFFKPGNELGSPALHADSLLSESPGSFQLQRGHLKSFSNQNLLSHQELIKNMRVQQG